MAYLNLAQIAGLNGFQTRTLTMQNVLQSLFKSIEFDFTSSGRNQATRLAVKVEVNTDK